MADVMWSMRCEGEAAWKPISAYRDGELGGAVSVKDILPEWGSGDVNARLLLSMVSARE